MNKHQTFVRNEDGSFRIIKVEKDYDFSGRYILKKKVERYNREGKLHGNTDLFIGGVINSSTPFVGGEISGEQRHWFRNGKLASTTRFVNGKEHGVHKTFDVDGVLAWQLKYRNGELFDGEQSLDFTREKLRDKQR
ncbi:MORN repeat-containing protein [Brazilian marseillevirus]|uniref:MORN repeat-containing protein n=1 Tax=Brazilian marseillevirus TaxID=1813599 RepID=UPI000780C334|nr:MORN repeat-containing protein [Brazilian marseillevirus]AMQ10924.1 MORN repeat-containing protein [Brazilian marseillevirus]